MNKVIDCKNQHAHDKVVPFSKLDFAVISRSLKARSYSVSDALDKISVVLACVDEVCAGIGVEDLKVAGVTVPTSEVAVVGLAELETVGTPALLGDVLLDVFGTM